jgi:transposase
VVFLRYGSLTEPGPPWHTFRRISEITGIKLMTTLTIVRKWRLNGFQVGTNKPHHRTRARWQTPEVVNYLTKIKTLTEWAHLSLEQRVILIEQKFGVKISFQTLSTFYKKHKVTYIKPQYTYNRKEAIKDELAVQQQKTVMEIAELMKAGKQVVYIDESQFHK